MTLTARILDALTQGPKTSPELASALGIDGRFLSNTIKHLLRTNQISRVQLSKGRWRYYIGQTAPDWQGYDTKPKPKPQHRIPVKTIDVARNYFGDATPIMITLPLPPWEHVA